MRFLFFKNPAKKNGILLLETEGACLCRPINWRMATMLGNSAVAVVVVVVRTRPRAIPLAMKTMRKFIHGFLFIPYEYGAPLGGPWGRRSSAIILPAHVYFHRKNTFVLSY